MVGAVKLFYIFEVKKNLIPNSNNYRYNRMNKFALLPFLLILFLNTKAQDRIITMNHDSIHCTILSINNESIRYELKNRDGSVTGKFINLSQVAEYTRSVQHENNREALKQKTFKPVNVQENQWCLGLNIGGSTMPWYFDNIQSTTAMPDYYNNLTTGFHINTSAHYMINSSLGLGAEYSFLVTSSSGSMSTQYNQSLFLMVYEKYRQYINYLGPSVLFVQHLDVQRKFTLSESFSGGLLFMRMEDQGTYPTVDNTGYTEVTNNSLLTGNSLSAKLGLTAEYRLNRNLSVGLGGDYLWSLLKKASFETRGPNNTSSSTKNQKLPNAMNLSRIDYSLVLRFHL